MQKYTYNRATGRLVAKAGMEKPQKEDFQDEEFEYRGHYTQAVNAYEAHLSTLPPDIIVSNEFKEVYKDKPEDWDYEEGVDFEIWGKTDSSPDVLFPKAYPIVKAEQEDQGALWLEYQRLYQAEYDSRSWDEWVSLLKQHFTIQRIKK